MLQCVIVDDSFFVRETLSKSIQEAGHNVIKTYDSGAGILDDMDNISPDVIFLDIILPDQSGLDILPRVKEKLSTTKVVMLSGMTQGQTIAAALKLGATDFVSKPISRDQLQDLLIKFSSNVSVPSVEELSKIGVGCVLVSSFLNELLSHASSTLRGVISTQSRSILESITKQTGNMFLLNTDKNSIEPNPELWGNYTEDEVFDQLRKVSQELQMELEFLYQKKFIESLFSQAILTMASRQRIIQLFELVNPNEIGLASIPAQANTTMTIAAAGTSFEALEKALSLSIYQSDMFMGPKVLAHLNVDLLDENDVIKNGIFYSTLIGARDENFHEALFGPLPVSIRSELSLSALVYPTKIITKEGEDPILTMIIIYFTEAAEKIVADYNKLSFIIKTRLSTIRYGEEIDRTWVRALLSDVISFILE
ncbi:MAG: response regulator [Candidatus Heimdallarchaeota archaeon]|nr:response regulator [Candidatus Heimdallarchaeota archaeon]